MQIIFFPNKYFATLCLKKCLIHDCSLSSLHINLSGCDHCHKSGVDCNTVVLNPNLVRSVVTRVVISTTNYLPTKIVIRFCYWLLEILFDKYIATLNIKVNHKNKRLSVKNRSKSFYNSSLIHSCKYSIVH